MAKTSKKLGEDEEDSTMPIPLFIWVPTLAVSDYIGDHEISCDSHFAVSVCASSLSSQSSVVPYSDRWMSSSSRENNVATVAAVAAPRFPRRLCSDLSGDKENEKEDDTAMPPTLQERKSLGEEPHYHDSCPKLPRRSWTLPSRTIAGMESLTFNFHEQLEKPEKLSPRPEDMEAPAALAA